MTSNCSYYLHFICLTLFSRKYTDIQNGLTFYTLLKNSLHQKSITHENCLYYLFRKTYRFV